MSYLCWDCNKHIEPNDEAMVCVECGGMNRRVPGAGRSHASSIGIHILRGIGLLFTLSGMLLWVVVIVAAAQAWLA